MTNIHPRVNDFFLMTDATQFLAFIVGLHLTLKLFLTACAKKWNLAPLKLVLCGFLFGVNFFIAIAVLVNTRFFIDILEAPRPSPKPSFVSEYFIVHGAYVVLWINITESVYKLLPYLTNASITCPPTADYLLILNHLYFFHFISRACPGGIFAVHYFAVSILAIFQYGCETFDSASSELQPSSRLRNAMQKLPLVENIMCLLLAIFIYNAPSMASVRKEQLLVIQRISVSLILLTIKSLTQTKNGITEYHLKGQ